MITLYVVLALMAVGIALWAVAINLECNGSLTWSNRMKFLDKFYCGFAVLLMWFFIDTYGFC